MPSISLVLLQSGVAFGTSGARGLVTDFTDQVCAAFTQSFASVMQRSFSFKRIAIGIDNRPSSPQMAAACAGALKSMGYVVDYYGVLPTPALAYQAMQDNVPAIMVTGSHIPFDRNGLKFYRPDGEITKDDEQAIITVSDELISSIADLPATSSVASDNYIKRYLDIFPKQMLAGKRIGIYEHSSAGRDLYQRVFKMLGAEVTSLERTNTFVPIDTEAVTDADKQKGVDWSKRYSFDVIFSTDGDGDRPLIADENGQWLRGDIVGLLCAKALGIQSLAIPVSCNTAIEKAEIFSSVVRTKIGSPYVIAAFANLNGFVAGFEANGGFLLGSDITVAGKMLKALPTRDALLPGLALLALAGEQPLSNLTANLPQRYTASDRLQQVPTHWSKNFIAKTALSPVEFLVLLGQRSRQIESLDQTDGLRMQFVDGDIVHLRPSGNAPELRCYVESAEEAEAQQLVQVILSAVKGLLN
ncbi:phosphomannomutase [Shewanella baltica]|uniref:phosphomannomutase n=1 Tax=Shewanella baltica TaxID=62322 RepID=UPI00217E0240|nr:phosphomannomutase [Shewanella baltica]MCS6098295.1 phosphomannomutase [Shewanella baltica]MCS6181481.1 phosphomannomutase [Shewanella baltica]